MTGEDLERDRLLALIAATRPNTDYWRHYMTVYAVYVTAGIVILAPLVPVCAAARVLRRGFEKWDLRQSIKADERWRKSRGLE